ncbi:MAG TPA: DUF3047 domain-containing protein [Gammaproteobacteria bacterium]
MRPTTPQRNRRPSRPALRLLALAALLCPWFAAAVTAPATTLLVGPASADGILGWEPKAFAGETRYRAEQRDGRPAVRADSQASASALLHEIDIDLTRTPYLSWSWQVGNLLPGIDERVKAGDDYPARVYVLFSGGGLDPRPLGFSYVWSSSQAKGATWPNAFTGRVVMLAVRDASDPLNQWVVEKRNVREDIRRYFGKEVEEVKAVAIMTDTDNSGRRATAWYGDIAFTAR